MSYPFGQFGSGDNYSTPPTPQDGQLPHPQWDTIEQEVQQQQSAQPQHQDQQQAIMQQSDLNSPGLPGGYPQTIQLDPPPQPPVVPSQLAHDDTPVHLHHVNQVDSAQQVDQSHQIDPRYENRFATRLCADSRIRVVAPDFGANSKLSHPNMAIRPARRGQHQQAQQQSHPYHRRGSTAVVAAARQQMTVFPVQPAPQQHVHFAPHPMVRQSSGGIVASAIPSTSSARKSPLVPSPSSRLASFSSSVNGSPVAGNSPLGSALLRASPGTMDPPPLPTPTQQTHAAPVKPRAYIIRMDTHYDPDTHLLTAVLEVPGVKREHLSVRLSTCSYNRVRQITVTGAVHPPFGIISPLTNPVLAASGAFELASNVSVRERKYGPCQRVIPVPSDLKREEIEAQLQDGVLILRFPCGAPAEEDGEDVAVL